MIRNIRTSRKRTRVLVGTAAAAVVAGVSLIGSGVVNQSGCGPNGSGGILASANACNTPTVPAPPVPTTADYYVSQGGIDIGTCTNPAAPCRTFVWVYQHADLTGTPKLVNVAQATNYPAQTILKGSQTQTGASLTFRCEVASVHACVVKDGSILLGQNNGNLNGDAPSNLTFDNIDIDQGHFRTLFNGPLTGTSGTTSCTATSTACYNEPQPTNLAYKNSSIWCTNNTSNNNACTSHLIYLISTDNFTATNMKLGPYGVSGDAFEVASPACRIFTGGSICPPPTSNTTLDRVDSADITDTCKHMLAVDIALHGCSGFGYGDIGDHTVLNGAIDSVQTTFTVAGPGGGNIAFPAGNVPFHVTVAGESMNVTAISGLVWTVQRGTTGCGPSFAATTAAAHPDATTISICDGFGYDHVDCFQAFAAHNVTIRRSSCLAMNPGGTVAQGYFFGGANCTKPNCFTGTFLFENNFVGSGGTCGICFTSQSIASNWGTLDFKAYNNTLFHGIRVDGPNLGPGSTISSIGNIASTFTTTLGGSSFNCNVTLSDGSVFAINSSVWHHNMVGRVCDPGTDISAAANTVSFVQGTFGANLKQDLHLAVGVTQVPPMNRGAPGPGVTTDYDGNPRPGPDGDEIGADVNG